MTTVVGIDPGLSGAIVFFKAGAGYMRVDDMPTFEVKRGGKTKRELDPVALGNILATAPGGTVAYVELVGAMPGQGVTSMFSFGKSYGMVLGSLGALQIPITHVTPQKWKKDMAVRGGKDGSRVRASELMPGFAHYWARVKDDGRAEAALIAYYGAMQGENGHG